MIVSRAPLRISFFGGGSDVPGYYRKGNPGIVLSTTINKFMYIVINETPNQHLKLMYSKIEVVDDVEKLEHDIAREILKTYFVDNGLEIASFADIPTIGTGMGSSSTFAVALISAMNALYGTPATKFDVAEDACRIEIETLNGPIGKQDQYAATFGGLNMYKFEESGVTVNPVNIHQNTYDDLQSRLLLFYTNKRRNANDILRVQNGNIPFEKLDKMVEMAEVAEQYLINSDLDSFGALLNDSWQMKKTLAPGITDQDIDEVYNAAMSAGSLGGKILGAGGGGYLLMYTPEDKIIDVVRSMQKYNLSCFDFTMYEGGVDIILNSRGSNAY